LAMPPPRISPNLVPLCPLLKPLEEYGSLNGHSKPAAGSAAVGDPSHRHELQGEQRQDGGGRRDHLRAGVAGLGHEGRQIDVDQLGDRQIEPGHPGRIAPVLAVGEHRLAPSHDRVAGSFAFVVAASRSTRQGSPRLRSASLGARALHDAQDRRPAD